MSAAPHRDSYTVWNNNLAGKTKSMDAVEAHETANQSKKNDKNTGKVLLKSLKKSTLSCVSLKAHFE